MTYPARQRARCDDRCAPRPVNLSRKTQVSPAALGSGTLAKAMVEAVPRGVQGAAIEAESEEVADALKKGDQKTAWQKIRSISGRVFSLTDKAADTIEGRDHRWRGRLRPVVRRGVEVAGRSRGLNPTGGADGKEKEGQQAY